MEEKNVYYNFGYETFGPFLYGFTSWLIKRFKETRPNKIFFFARDGYMMQKAYQILKLENFKYEYVYFSRNSLRQALLWKESDFKSSLKYFSVSKYVMISEILEYYGVLDDESVKIASEIGFSIHDEVEYSIMSDDTRLIKLYDILEDKIKKHSKQQYDLLYTYLLQIGIDGRCAIVDIGWHGNMQYYLEEMLSISGMKAEIDGYYVGIAPVSKIKGRTYGYLYDGNNQKLRKKVLCFFGLFEKLFQCTEGSVKEYLHSDNIVVPILKEYEYVDDNEFISNINSWQSGALDYVMNNKSVKDLDFHKYADKLIKLGVSPTLKDISIFKKLYNNDGEKIYYLPQKSLFEYKPKELIHALSNSVWKTGFMKSLFKIPLPYYYIYKIMKK